MNKPAPLSAFDAFFHLALIVTLRGTQQTVDYYKMLLAEMQERVAQGIGAVAERKIPAPLGQPARLVPDEVALREVRLPGRLPRRRHLHLGLVRLPEVPR